MFFVLVGACVVDEDVETSTIVDEVMSTNRIALNRIALNGMARNSLQSEGQRQGSLMETAEGRDLMAYVVSCALPANQTVTFSTPNGPFSYKGSIGLAPTWWTRTPTASERRWVSACLLARTNRFGVTVEISMRGNHSALTPAAGERAAFLLFEGAFWGDVFTADGTLNACLGALKEANSLLGVQVSTFGKRDCTISDDGITTRCGFSYRGPCALAGSTMGAETISVYLSSKLL
jgi:hypothetical protein